MGTFCEHTAFFDEGMSFYKSGQIIQESDFRIRDDEIDLFGPIIYLFRHAAELFFKALIIRNLYQNGCTDWKSVKLKSNSRKLSSTHSIQELYLSWKELGGEVSLNPREIELLEYYIDKLDCHDKDSTFFRYPVDRDGKRNKRALTEELDADILNTLPCHLGALVYEKGIERFACLHREQFMEDLEEDADELVKLLILIWNKYDDLS